MKQKEQENFLDKRSLLAIVLLGVCWLSWDFYMKKKYPDHYQRQTKEESTNLEDVSSSKKEALKALTSPQSPPKSLAKSQAKIKTLTTGQEKLYSYSGEHVDFQISSQGLGVKNLKLKKYFNRAKEPVLFQGEQSSLFASKLLGSSQLLNFKVQKKDQTFIGRYSNSEFTIEKKIYFDEEHLKFKVTTKVSQHRSKAIEGLSLLFSSSIPPEKKSNFLINIFTLYGKDFFEGFVLTKEDETFLTKEDVQDEKKFPLAFFIGVGNKYFGKAFVNKSDLLPSVTLKATDQFVLGQIDYKFLHSKPNVLEYEIFYGPKSNSQLRSLSREAIQWINLGFFSFLARPILLILTAFHSVFNNWGVAIILLTLFIRFCLLPLNIKSYKSMAVMQKIQPKMKEIRKQYKGKPQEMNQKVLELMREHKANPFGSFLPMLLQLPIFFALYRVLAQSVELYQSPFIFWIQDLSLKDPYFILPFLSGATFFIQQKITPTNLPPAQARLLTFMPIVFSVFMVGLPSGLTLYIFVSGLFGVIQHVLFIKTKDTIGKAEQTEKYKNQEILETNKGE